MTELSMLSDVVEMKAMRGIIARGKGVMSDFTSL